MPLRTIRELDDLSVLEGLAAEYENKYGSPPFELSHWDPSTQTIRAFLKDLKLPEPAIAVPYVYSYDLDIQPRVIERLGLAPDRHDCVIVPSGTNAILFATWWLKTLGIRQLLILCPTYFPVFHACEMVHLPYLRIYMRRSNRNWRLPTDEIMAMLASGPAQVAVWFTNPVYCTGVYLGADEAEFADSLLARSVAVVADECLSLSGLELGRKLGHSDRFLGLYSPHKSVSINAVKFAAIVFDRKYRRFFTDWTDVLVGGLSASNHSAVMHFLSDNFLEFQEGFLVYIDRVRQKMNQFVRGEGSSIELDETSKGNFVTCYVPRLPVIGNCEELLRQVVFNTGAIMIPGSRNHFDPELGFNFRINLARACPQFYSALRRSIDYLAGIA